MKHRDPTPRPRQRAAVLWRRWGGLLIGALVIVGLAVLVWRLLSDTASTRREVAATPMLVLPPPPPPPPEPEKLPEPEPEKIKPEVVEPKPADPQEAPKDDAPPSPSKDLGDPVTIDGAAQAGTDAFGIQAGSGGGMTGGGGGLGSRSYASYVSNALQQAFARDQRTRQLAFEDIRIDLWLDADGKATRAQLVRGTGNAQTDEAVLAMVRDFRADERPPASLRFPMRMSIKGRRP
ncbi:energy transducer TonB [Cupriavidus sp. 2MCAB6]|uniref:energy transducer TonB family protein n=1 Tax=Cupriavidus sp. 2MCAB6 TaxID=3232981 RepID=UPI003F9296D3